MRENNLLCTKFKHRNRAYKSYKGKIGKTAKNELNRRFITYRPYQNLLTDVTQFNIKKGQLKLPDNTAVIIRNNTPMKYIGEGIVYKESRNIRN